MIVRIIWKPVTPMSSEGSQTSDMILRTEGGWWFSETNVNTGDCVCYKVETRLSLDDGRAVCEVLTPLPDSFIATPCWQDGPPQPWIRRQEGWQLPSGLLVTQGQPFQLPLALQVPEHLRTEAQNKLPPRVCDEFQGPKDLTDPSQLGRPYPTPQGGSPLRKRLPHGFSSGIPPAPTPQASPSSPQAPDRGQPPQPESQGSASASPKAVQTGSLCSPKLLPDVPPPRKKESRPQGRRGPPSQDRQLPQMCLIDPQLS